VGNAICLFNIVAAAVVAGIQDTNAILKRVIFPVLLAGLVIGIGGMALYFFTT
jgi:lactate permease